MCEMWEGQAEICLEVHFHTGLSCHVWDLLWIGRNTKCSESLIQGKPYIFCRLERLQRLAEKVHREMKQVDSRLEELEQRVEDEARRLDRLHPLDAKHNVDLLEQDIRLTEESINSLFGDVQSLRDGRYPQAPELHKRWVR